MRKYLAAAPPCRRPRRIAKRIAARDGYQHFPPPGWRDPFFRGHDRAVCGGCYAIDDEPCDAWCPDRRILERDAEEREQRALDREEDSEDGIQCLDCGDAGEMQDPLDDTMTIDCPYCGPEGAR